MKLEGVSVYDGHSRVMTEKRNQSNRRHLTLGEHLEKQGKVMIPKEAIPKEVTVEPGDFLLIGEGPAQMKSPAEGKKNGCNFLRVESVKDKRQDEILPHIAVTVC